MFLDSRLFLILEYSHRLCILTFLMWKSSLDVSLCGYNYTQIHTCTIFMLFTFPSSCGKRLSLCRGPSHRWAPGLSPGRCGLGNPSQGCPRRNQVEVSSESPPPLLVSPCCETRPSSSWWDAVYYYCPEVCSFNNQPLSRWRHSHDKTSGLLHPK